MRSFTLEQYEQMAERFNKMSFREKIVILQKNSDILALGSDHNWWVVQVKDRDIGEKLYEKETGFNIVNEWDAREMHVLVDLLGIEITDV